jgi:uncharacterized protein YkwD
LIKSQVAKTGYSLVAGLILITLLTGCGTASLNTTPAAAVTSLPPAPQELSASPSISKQPSPSPLPSTIIPPTTTLTPVHSPSSTPTLTPAYLPSPTPTPTALPFPTLIYQPAAEPYIPTSARLELFKYVLQLINKDRSDRNLPPVELAFNAAAQKHAQDMLDNNYLAHWGTDGLKPYMRYTDEGGYNYEQENSAYYSSSEKIDPYYQIQRLEAKMVYDDASSNWGHRDNIWNPLHKKVSIGVAYNNNTVTLVQQFEGDYVEFFQPPTLKGNILSLSGHFKAAGLALNNAAITFDPLPKPLTGPDLMSNATYHAYGLGARLGQIFPPPPTGLQYPALPAGSIIAAKGQFENSDFWLETDISAFLDKGPGVYTVCLIVVLNNRPTNFSNYSIMVK